MYVSLIVQTFDRKNLQSISHGKLNLKIPIRLQAKIEFWAESEQLENVEWTFDFVPSTLELCTIRLVFRVINSKNWALRFIIRNLDVYGHLEIVIL